MKRRRQMATVTVQWTILFRFGVTTFIFNYFFLHAIGSKSDKYLRSKNLFIGWTLNTSHFVNQMNSRQISFALPPIECKFDKWKAIPMAANVVSLHLSEFVLEQQKRT